jgi:formate-dependent nitrite reductase membrane component NrfD
MTADAQITPTDDTAIQPQKARGGSFGAAHLDPRDAYRDVPILKRPTWNHEVAAYFFFGGVSAGAAMVGSIADIVGGERHKRLGRTAHYVSFATLLPCPPLLIDDLGMPERFHHMMRVVKPSSPMNLGAWALLLHGAGATVTVGRMMAEEGRLPLIGWLARLIPERLLAGLGFPSSFLLAGYTGVLLGTTAIPAWYKSPLLGALFMSSAFTGGVAATSLLGEITRRETEEEELELAEISLASSLTEAALLVGYVATTGPAAKPLLSGGPGKLLAGAAACMLTAAALEAASVLSKPKRRSTTMAAAVVSLAGAAMLRWAVVRAGRESAADREGTLEAMQPHEGNPGWGPPSKARRGQGNGTPARPASS